MHFIEALLAFILVSYPEPCAGFGASVTNMCDIPRQTPFTAGKLQWSNKCALGVTIITSFC